MFDAGLETGKEINSYAFYFEQVSNEQLKLSAEEEMDCIIKYQSTGDIEARDKVINNNLLFVLMICKEQHKSWEDLLELISIGYMALMKSLDTFKIEKGYSFRTHAASTIKWNIIKYRNDIYNTSNLPALLYRTLNKAKEIQKEKYINSGRYYTNDELRDILTGTTVYNRKVSNKQIDKIFNIIDFVSLDSMPFADGDSSIEWQDMLGYTDGAYESVEAAMVVSDAIKVLKKRERDVIYLRYWKELSANEIADILRISPGYVYICENKALNKMRKKLIDSGGM